MIFKILVRQLIEFILIAALIEAISFFINCINRLSYYLFCFNIAALSFVRTLCHLIIWLPYNILLTAWISLSDHDINIFSLFQLIWYCCARPSHRESLLENELILLLQHCLTLFWLLRIFISQTFAMFLWLPLFYANHINLRFILIKDI